MKLNWNFWRGGELQIKNYPWGRYGYFGEPYIVIWKCSGILGVSRWEFQPEELWV